MISTVQWVAHARVASLGSLRSRFREKVEEAFNSSFFFLLARIDSTCLLTTPSVSIMWSWLMVTVNHNHDHNHLSKHTISLRGPTINSIKHSPISNFHIIELSSHVALALKGCVGSQYMAMYTIYAILA